MHLKTITPPMPFKAIHLNFTLVYYTLHVTHLSRSLMLFTAGPWMFILVCTVKYAPDILDVGHWVSLSVGVFGL